MTKTLLHHSTHFSVGSKLELKIFKLLTTLWGVEILIQLEFFFGTLESL